ncbi:MAG: 1-deoxy-D-xylulose-5-phosphate synthase [Candidatus Omnitrophota bacterium]
MKKVYQWIEKINSPEDLKAVPLAKLPDVAAEYRDFMIDSVSKTGGHLGASLGALEINLALHYVLHPPQDKICWDVGHQAYAHKMITGRRAGMKTLRQHDGLSGFPSPFESPYDPFLVGHAGTAISQALGLAAARDLKGGQERVVAVVGDGALTAGLSYEALNNAGHLKKNMLILLNDNEMSIARNVGGVSKYLNRVITNPLYNRIRTEVEKQLGRFPRLRRLANNSLESMKHILVPGIIFEELGLRYFGPIDGHDLPGLIETLQKVLALPQTALLHVITQKGKGYEFAEKDEERLHGVMPFDVRTGEKIKGCVEIPGPVPVEVAYTEAFSKALLRIARKNPDVVAITAAMPTGTGLANFQKEFPSRFFDVGIAEQHAVTFAGALAKGGLKPVCAIYSTFLQRAYDPLVHDVALQDLSVVFGLDRAGLVGADGPTHHGVFDIAFLAPIPGAVIAAPVNAFEMERMLELGLRARGIFALRYPRSNIGPSLERLAEKRFSVGQAEILEEGEDVCLLALGSMVERALEAAQKIRAAGKSVQVVNMRFAKPLDGALLKKVAKKFRKIYTLEEHVLTGGFGALVLEWFEKEGLDPGPVARLALPDLFIEHGSRDKWLHAFGLSAERIAERVLADLPANFFSGMKVSAR